MSENFDNLSTQVRAGSPFSSNRSDNDDGSCVAELNKQLSNVEIDSNRFRLLCDNVRNCLFQVNSSVFELLDIKDKLLIQYLPLNVASNITLTFSRFYRNYSESQTPINELIRLTQLYCQPFDMKCAVLKQLYDRSEINKRLLKLAIQKVTYLETQAKKHHEQKCANYWEKMYIALTLPRSQVRKWKFRMDTFRKKAKLGYDHVIKWIRVKELESSTLTDISSVLKSIDEESETQLVKNDDIVTMLNKNKQKSTYDRNNLDNDDDGGFHIQEEESFLTSVVLQESKLFERKSLVETTDVESQIQPSLCDQNTTTQEVIVNRGLIMRLYPPSGISKTKFQCIVHAQGQVYTTNVFKKPKISKEEEENIQEAITTIKRSQTMHSQISSCSYVSVTTTDISTYSIDDEHMDEILIPMPNFLTRRSLLDEGLDPNGIKIDVLADEELCGTIIILSEDLYMFDLPNLYNSNESTSTSDDDDDRSKKSAPTYELDLDESSLSIYQSWLSRSPYLFTIYDQQHEAVGKLPLLLFWYNKVAPVFMSKSTMTLTTDINGLESGVGFVQGNSVRIHVATQTTAEILDEQIEKVKKNYENKIVEIHANYQAEITRLTNLLNDLINPKSDENHYEDNQQLLSNANIQQNSRNNEFSSKNFLDRYQLYLQRSAAHRQELIAQVTQETALANERAMEFQHRLHKPNETNEYDCNLTLPAVFMPIRSRNVFNPRAHEYFHPFGSVNSQLTQSPTILTLPPLPGETISVLNLFEQSQRYINLNQKNYQLERKT